MVQARQKGLGAEFVEEIIRVWDTISENPLLNSRRHSTQNIRWRYPARFPYRVTTKRGRAIARSWSQLCSTRRDMIAGGRREYELAARTPSKSAGSPKSPLT